MVARICDIYRPVLADLDDISMRRAVNGALAECEHFPVPAELRRLAGIPKAENADERRDRLLIEQRRRAGRAALDHIDRFALARAD